jgi:hypothetical protein
LSSDVPGHVGYNAKRQGWVVSFCWRVAAWYESYGAMKLRDAPLCLVLPLETVATALRAANKL